MNDEQPVKADPSKFWALVELFGHSQVAGEVSEFVLGGEAFLRVDVPANDGQQAFTKMYGGKAIYAITPMDKEAALALVGIIEARPVEVYRMSSAVHEYMKRSSNQKSLSHRYRDELVDELDEEVF